MKKMKCSLYGPHLLPFLFLVVNVYINQLTGWVLKNKLVKVINKYGSWNNRTARFKNVNNCLNTVDFLDKKACFVKINLIFKKCLSELVSTS